MPSGKKKKNHNCNYIETFLFGWKHLTGYLQTKGYHENI